MAGGLEPGYYRLTGNPFTIYVVSVEEAAEGSDDDWLRLLGAKTPRTSETVAWYDEWLVYYEKFDPVFASREEFQRMRYKILESMTPQERLAGLPPEQVGAALSSLPSEQVGAALSYLPPDEQFLALPDEVLRSLPSDYIDSLPVRVRRALRKRLARLGVKHAKRR